MSRIQRSLINHIIYVQDHYDVDEITSFRMAEAMVGELL